MSEPGISILIADDHEIMRAALLRILTDQGHRVTSVRNGMEAWMVLERIRVDLVICDWNMPQMTGQELLEKIRASNELKTLPFFMLTGDTTPGKVQNAIRCGIDDFIVKPFSAKLLESKIASFRTHQHPTDHHAKDAPANDVRHQELRHDEKGDDLAGKP